MAEFDVGKPIYLQMVDRLCDEILSGQYPEEGRIPSVREYSALLGVNMNTSFKAFEQLAREGIIYNKRGLGYFVAAGAKDRIEQKKRSDFMSRLPEMFRQMKLLDIDISDIDREWEKFK